MALRAEAEKAPAPAAAPKTSTALVPMTEENIITTAGLLGGIVGLLVGGVWIGGALFAAASYFAREDDDIGKALKGIAVGGMEAINFSANVNEKYTVTDKVGKTISEAAEKAIQDEEQLDSIKGTWSQAASAVDKLDKDINIKSTVGSLLVGAGDIASQAVKKGVELNTQYKVTDQIKAKIEESTKETK